MKHFALTVVTYIYTTLYLQYITEDVIKLLYSAPLQSTRPHNIYDHTNIKLNMCKLKETMVLMFL